MKKNITNNCRAKPLDLDAIRNNPIWKVEPRLLIIDSIVDRSVAKSIAEDAVDHTFIFVSDVENIALYEVPILGGPNNCVETNNFSDEVSAEINNKNLGTSCDEIDWNDI